MSFDPMTKMYDETRVFDRNCFNSALDYLAERFPPSIFNKLLEPGIGTGRIAIPLAERGYQVTGVDISKEMLEFLEKRIQRARRPLPISFHKANVIKLPFPDEAFDIAIAVHLFYFIRDWAKAVDEILRVLRQGGPLVLIHTGTGTEVPFMNTRYKELCSELGCSIKEVGVSSTSEVVDYVVNLGHRVEWIRDRWCWTQHIKLNRALMYMKSRAYSFTRLAPNDVHLEAIKKLESEIQQQFGDLTANVEVPNQVYLVLILSS